MPRQLSLFTRIFLWFGVTVFTLLAVTVIASLATGPSPIRIHLRRSSTFLQPLATALVESYERLGPSILPGGAEGAVCIFGRDGRRLAGSMSPPPPDGLVARAAAEDGAVFAQDVDGRYAARTIRGRRGTYVVVWRHAQVVEWQPSDLRLIAGRLALIAVTAGVLCLGLARSLAAPVIELQVTTRALAEGSLAVRVAQDVAERQDEIGALARDLDVMARRLNDVLETHHRLLGDVSHELRSPLTRLNVALELARSQDASKTGFYLDRIERESQRLAALVEEVLTLTELRGTDHLATREPVDLAALVEEIADDANFEATDGRSVDVRSAPCIVLGSRELLRRAIENVVRNGLHHTARGTSVDVILERRGDRIHLEVRDRGPGVPDAEIPKLFRAFHRVTQSRDRISGGHGLGLAITERAVSLHDGSVSAAQHPDGGLTVMFDLPCTDI